MEQAHLDVGHVVGDVLNMLAEAHSVGVVVWKETGVVLASGHEGDVEGGVASDDLTEDSIELEAAVLLAVGWLG